MKTEKINLRMGIIVLMILAAAFSRIIPHPLNFAPIGAIAIFGAAYFSNRIIAFILPLLSLWISDLVLNNTVYASYNEHIWLFPSGFPWIWLSFILITLVGIFLLKKVKISSVMGASLSASAIFFLVSNYVCWPGNPMYTQDLSGLVTCYIAGIPFLWNTLAGDLFYSALLFTSFELAKKKFPKLAIAH